MTKNKLILYDIPLYFMDSYDTNKLRVENLMNQMKEYFDNEGFITDIISDEQYYYINIGFQDFITKISIRIRYDTTSLSLCYGVYGMNNVYSYGSSVSLNISDTKKTTMCINYFVNDYFFGVLCHPLTVKTYAGFGSYGTFVCKSEDGDEYYRKGNSNSYIIYNSNTNASISFSNPSQNLLNINNAILNKISVTNGYLNQIYILNLPKRSQPISNSDISGGIYFFLNGYGKFFCFYAYANILFAIPITEETI